MILALGDSKSAPTSEDWPKILAHQLETSTGMGQWRSIALGRGGYTVDNFENNVDAYNDGQFLYTIIDSADHGCETGSPLERCTTSLRGTHPAQIFVNLGVNDVGFVPPWVLPNETTWKNDYLAALDTISAQWPDSLVYLTKPWKTQSGGVDAVWDTMAGWIDDVIAARPAFARAGDDERSWFKPNVGTYSDDGIHFNAAGQLAAAAAKLAALP